MSSWQTILRSAAKRVAEDSHYRKSSTLAHHVLSAVESQRGATDRALIRRSNEYAREVLGNPGYAPWLHVYCAVSGRFAEGWIPSNYYATVVSPLKNGLIGRTTDLKNLTNRILHTEALPDVAYLVDGKFYSRGLVPVADEDLPARLFEHDDRVFFKANDSDQGRGLTIFRKDDFKVREVPRAVDGVFQAPIKQQEFFAELSPRSTATIRITTARTLPGNVEVRAAYLRVGRADDEYVKSATSFRIPLDRQTGVLESFGYMHDWRRAERHPDTHARFAGKTIPCFQDATALCKSLHESFPYLACVGWDVCVDRDDKVRIMEWNARQNDIKFSEATTGPCFQGLGWENLWKSRSRARSPV